MPTSLVEDIAYKKSALLIQKTERMLIVAIMVIGKRLYYEGYA